MILLSQVTYLIIAIAILVALLIVFVVSFVLYRKTPVPKGCEYLKINDENCSMCGHEECSHYKGETKE